MTNQVQVVEQVCEAQQLLKEAHPDRSQLCWGLTNFQLLTCCSQGISAQGQASEEAQQAQRGPRKQSSGASALKEGWSPPGCAHYWMPVAEASVWAPLDLSQAVYPGACMCTHHSMVR